MTYGKAPEAEERGELCSGRCHVPPHPVAVGHEGMQLRLAVGGISSSSQRADHFPGLLQPTGVDANKRAQKKGQPLCFRRGPVFGANGARHPLQSTLCTPNSPFRVSCPANHFVNSPEKVTCSPYIKYQSH